MNDRQILIDALEKFLPVYNEWAKDKTVLGMYQPPDELIAPLKAAIESCEAFEKVAGHSLFSANSGIVMQASEMVYSLLFKLENIPLAVDWLLKVLTTRKAKGIFKAAIWGLETEEEINISENTKIIPFENLERTFVSGLILERSQKLWQNAQWFSQRYFDKPKAAYVQIIENFPYYGMDAFDKIKEIELEAREYWNLIESIGTGKPLAFGAWFDYADHDLDLKSWENRIAWSVPEVEPYIKEITRVNASSLSQNIKAYFKLPEELRDKLLRSMKRFTLSQCRHELNDRVLDLALAYEIAVSDKGPYAPPSYKLAVRVAQLIGGNLETRLANRKIISDFYDLRNAATHGGSVTDESKAAIHKADELHKLFIEQFLKYGRKPDWNKIELEPEFE